MQSLEQLARQSRINYTVLANSSAHQYFINMKNAEDKLYTYVKHHFSYEAQLIKIDNIMHIICL